MLKTRSAWMPSSSFLHETKSRKFTTFSSQSSGSFWPTVVLARTDRQFRRMNLLHQLGPPINSVTFICLASSFALRRIITVVTAWLFSLWLIIHSFKVLSNAGNFDTSTAGALTFWQFGHDILFLSPVTDHGFIDFKLFCCCSITDFICPSDNFQLVLKRETLTWAFQTRHFSNLARNSSLTRGYTYRKWPMLVILIESVTFLWC